MALREVIALLDVRVQGVERIKKANVGLDAFVAKMRASTVANVQGAGSLGGAGLLATLGPVGLAIGAVTLGVAVATKVIGKMADEAEGLVREMIALGTHLKNASRQFGVSTDDLQRWQFIAEQNGVEAGALTATLGRMQRQAFATPRVFAQIGVHVRGANGEIKDASTLLEETGRALGAIRNPAERAARAQQIFGRSGRLLLPIFTDGERGIARLSARFRELGGGMSGETVESADAAGNALGEVNQAIVSLKAAIVRDVLPAIAGFLTKVATVIGMFVEWARKSNMAKVAMYGIIGVILLAASPLLALGAAIAYVLLEVEDLYTAFTGGDSAFGRWVESITSALGVTRTFAGMLEELGIWWDNLRARVLAAVATMREAFASLGPWFGSTAGAAGARAEADRAEADIVARRKALNEHERQRFVERATSAQAVIAASVAPTVPVPAAGGTNQSSTTNLAPVINIHGVQDPEAAGRAAAREIKQLLRGAGDALPLAPEAAR